MRLTTIITSPFGHRTEEELFGKIIQFLKTTDTAPCEEGVLIANLTTGSTHIDALLLTRRFIKVILFKDYGGLIALDGQRWTADGKIIEGGAMRKTPDKEMQQLLRQVARSLNLQEFASCLSGTLLFTHPATISPDITAQTAKWMTIGDSDRLCVLPEHCPASPVIPQSFINHITSTFTPAASEPVSQTIYDAETASSFFEELETARKAAPDFREVYDRYSRVFKRLVQQNTASAQLKFAGDLPRTEYLLKERGADNKQRAHIHDARVRIRKRETLSEKTCKLFYEYDYEALATFISIVYKTEIPSAIKINFPALNFSRPEKKIMEDHYGKKIDFLRMQIKEWDDNLVYGRIESYGDDIVKASYTELTYAQVPDGDEQGWRYLKDYFMQDMEINLIHPRFQDGVIYSELIILEPDILVDVTSVAKCCEEYGTTELAYLINKLEPVEQTRYMTLGNLAGQFLDEEVHGLSDKLPFGKSLGKFCKEHPLEMLTSQELMAHKDEFKTEAQIQRQNIRKVVTQTLPDAFKDFDRRNVILEPSFFSPMLGLQGRMDFMQLDKSLVIEQKSGKAGYSRIYNNTLTAKQIHMVQVLLYQMIFRYNYNEEYVNKGKRIFLLFYSKFENGLIGLGYMPALAFMAIKIRNQIACNELQYATNGFHILDDIQADDLLLDKGSTRFFNDYKRKGIEAVLSPIQKASPLERAYFFRFMKFIETEHILQKIGSSTRPDSGFAAVWLETAADKRNAGNIYDNMILRPLPTEDSIEEISFDLPEDVDNDIANFRTGDIVIVYPYKKENEPDATSTFVFRGYISRLEKDSITILLRNPQSNARVFEYPDNYRWAVERDFLESSYNSLYSSMLQFLTAPKERRDLILMQREPEVDTSLTLKGSYGDFNDLMLRVKQAKDLYLIMGPPGTGKTSYGMLNTLQEALMEDGTSVLLVSYTNRAVDEICSKLLEAEIDFIRMGNELSCDEAYRSHLLKERAGCYSKLSDIEKMLREMRVYVATTSAMNKHSALFKLKHFDLAIVDEASQILEPNLMGLLSATYNGQCAIRKFVFIGDHKQLPAVVQQTKEESAANEPLLKDIGLTNCRESFFQRFYERYGDDASHAWMLTKQGRMHHDIAIFPNHCFYENKLEEVPLDFQDTELPTDGREKNGIDNLLSTRRIAFIAVRSEKKDAPSDKVNPNEADVIAALASRIFRREKEDFTTETLGIIVPYRNQIVRVRNTINRLYPDVPTDKITIDTVERYQGSQRAYIIYGFTVKEYYQLEFLTSTNFVDTSGNVIDRKLNVAMTRAKEHLLIVGNPDLLNNNFIYFKLMEFIKSKQGWFDIDKTDFINGKFDVPTYERADFDMGDATYTLSEGVDKAYKRCVGQTIKALSGSDYPKKIFGNDMDTNLHIIGYGRINFSNQAQLFDTALTPEKQVLLYCYYIMRMHYCSATTVYTAFHDLLKTQIEAFGGRVQLLDIGCGPATCGLAFGERFLPYAPEMCYTGIDISVAMQNKGRELLDSVFAGKLHYDMKDSFYGLDSNYWEAHSELPTLFVLNFSYVFSNLSAKETEKLATHIVQVMKRYPLNKYLFIIQQGETDTKIQPYKVFRQVLKEHVSLIKADKDRFSYCLKSDKKELEFCYELFQSH